MPTRDENNDNTTPNPVWAVDLSAAFSESARSAMAFTESLRISGHTAAQAGVSLREAAVATSVLLSDRPYVEDLLEENPDLERIISECMAEQLARDMEDLLLFGDPEERGEGNIQIGSNITGRSDRGGLLNPEQSANFVRTLIDGRSLLSEVREVPLKGSQEFYVICFTRTRKLKLTGR